MRNPIIDGRSFLRSILPHSLALLIFMYGGKAARGQQPPASGSQPPSSSGSSPADSTQPKNDRILGVLPNYRTVENPQFNIQPLTVKGKFKLAVEDSFDPYAYPVALIFAGLAQNQNDPKTWGREDSGPLHKALRGLVRRPNR